MSDLTDLLNTETEVDNPSLSWQVRMNASGNTRVTAVTRDAWADRALAYAGAEGLLEKLLNLGYELGPTSDVGAQYEDFEQVSWRGRVDVILWPPGGFAEALAR